MVSKPTPKGSEIKNVSDITATKSFRISMSKIKRSTIAYNTGMPIMKAVFVRRCFIKSVLVIQTAKRYLVTIRCISWHTVMAFRAHGRTFSDTLPLKRILFFRALVDGNPQRR
jgi:hypothetical protein